MKLPQGKKIYFASDNHLGAPTAEKSAPREAHFCCLAESHPEGCGGSFFIRGSL